METETIDRLFLELSQVTQATTGKEIRLKEQNQILSKHVVSLTQEREDLLDLLTSARAIALRHGEDTAWDRFSERLRLAGAGSVTPKTFRVLPIENTQAGSNCHERFVLPLWAEYGEGPPKRGDYNIKVQSKDGREKIITAWHNPGNGHWLADGKECGYVDIITPLGETEEWRITHWQNAKTSGPTAASRC